jgi:hypothetical protein
VPSFDVVMPMADHRICVRHLYANFRDKGFRGVALKELLWKAASAYTEVEFRFQMEEMKKVSPDAFDYLDKIDPSGWSRAWFSDYPKCDLLVNNICECFNSYILKARDKPILTMLEMIRKQLMRRYQLKRDGINKLKGKLCPRIVEKLEAIGEAASDCLSRFAGDGIFEVEQGRRQYAVDLRRRTCGCRQWEVTGIPCAHAHSAITFHGHKPEDYVDSCYSIEMYKKAYAPIIYPMPSEEQWVKTAHDVLDPPRSRKMPGRPRKARVRGPDESRVPQNPYRMRKFGLKGRCGICKLVGHNNRTCPMKKDQPSTEVDLPTPPPASLPTPPSTSVSLTNQYSCIVVDVLLMYYLMCY